MSDIVRIPPHGHRAAGKEKTGGKPPSEEGFLSFVSLWEEAEKGGDVEAPAVDDPFQKLREREEEIKRQGEEILRLARENAVRIEAEAHDKGFAKGEAEGLAAGQQKFDEAARRFGALMTEVEGNLHKRNSHYEEELLALVTTMTDRLVQHEVSLNPRVIQACLRRAMAFVVDKSVVKVHLHPNDFNRIKEASLENPALLEGKNRIELMEDGGIAEGGCFLETDFGDVDATLEHGRDKLYEAVEQAFRTSLVEEEGAPPAT